MSHLWLQLPADGTCKSHGHIGSRYYSNCYWFTLL